MSDQRSSKELVEAIKHRHAEDLVMITSSPHLAEHYPDSWQTPADIAELLKEIERLQAMGAAGTGVERHADEPSPRQDIARKLEEIRERAQFRGWADIGTSAVEDREFLLSYIYRLENQERPAEPPKALPAHITLEIKDAVNELDCAKDCHTAGAMRIHVVAALLGLGKLLHSETKSAKCALKGCDNDAPLGGVCADHETGDSQ